ncbi:MAG TPA: DUF1553 domain-containing protein [Verrucomicrobiae bacterium]
MNDANPEISSSPNRSGKWRTAVFAVICLVLAGSVLLPLWRNKPPPAPKNFQSKTQPDAAFADVVARVDAAFEKEWQAASVKPAPAAPILTLARRLSLGLTGTLPSLEEIRALEQQPAELALQWWLARLLEDRRYSDYLAERFARVYVGVENGPFLIYRRHRMVDWLSTEIQKNRPYDEITRELINANGIWTTQPEVNFITVTVDQNNKKRGPDEIKLAGRVSRAFLGVRLDCVQCHNDFMGGSWEQKHFHELAAFFAPAEMSMTGVRDSKKKKYEFRYHGKMDDQVVSPRVPFKEELLPQEGALRERLAKWVTHPENMAFARTTVNRIWALMFNRPLVEPIDDIPLEGTYPPGMEILARDLVVNHYDLQRLIRLIAASRVFHLDSTTRDSEHHVTDAQEKLYASFPITRLRPEQVAGGIIQASSLRTIDAEAHILWQLTRFFQQGDFVKRYGDIGEDEFNQRSGTIPQRLLMMNGKLVDERSDENIVMNASTRIASLAPDDASAVETAYLCALTRRPTAAEQDHFVELLKGIKGKARFRVMEDLYWSLLNATEFSWNH